MLRSEQLELAFGRYHSGTLLPLKGPFGKKLGGQMTDIWWKYSVQQFVEHKPHRIDTILERAMEVKPVEDDEDDTPQTPRGRVLVMDPDSSPPRPS